MSSYVIAAPDVLGAAAADLTGDRVGDRGGQRGGGGPDDAAAGRGCR